MNTSTLPPAAEFRLACSDPDFPTSLTQTHPIVRMLFGQGSRDLVTGMGRAPGIAVVGSRQASAQGREDAFWFAKELSSHGVTVISGLAQGIDACAHAGALEGKAKTIAVLGHGLDSIYPTSNDALAKKILKHSGALVTEYPKGTPARAFQFPQRNRIIAGLARAILVVEASPQSGSLITARHGLELGIDVFVIPGSIHMPQSIGCNMLIRQGAQLVQSPQQLLEDLGVLLPKAQARHRKTATDLFSGNLDARARSVFAALSFQPASSVALQTATGLAAGDVHAGLLLLELENLASRLPDGSWLRYRLS
jgi:DNA processing protein